MMVLMTVGAMFFGANPLHALLALIAVSLDLFPVVKITEHLMHIQFCFPGTHSAR